MSTLTDFLTGIANAIRAKTGTSAAIPAQNFAAEIAAIQTGYDTADATGGAGQMLSPYTAYGPNGKFTGAIPSQNATTITPGTSAKTAISAGTYAAGAATVAGDANLVAGNIKEGVSIFGVTGSFAGGGGTVTGEISYASSCSAIWVNGNEGVSTSDIYSMSPIQVNKDSLLVFIGYSPRGEGYPSGSGDCELIYGGKPNGDVNACFRVFGNFSIGTEFQKKADAISHEYQESAGISFK